VARGQIRGQKLLGAWASLYLAQRFNLEVIQVIGDSKIIIEWLKDRGKLQVASLMGWMDNIKSDEICV
jgi:hypothetical protein